MRFILYVIPGVLIIGVGYIIAIHRTMASIAKTYPCTQFGCDTQAVGLRDYLPYCQEHLTNVKR